MRQTFAPAWLPPFPVAVLALLAPIAGAHDEVEPAPASAREAAEPFDSASGRDVRNYPPDPQVDFQHIKLDLRMPDPMSRSFTCTETITFRTTERPVDRLKLNAVNLDIKRITDLSGQSLDFR